MSKVGDSGSWVVKTMRRLNYFRFRSSVPLGLRVLRDERIVFSRE